MADVTITKASIRPLGLGIDFRAVAGETMTLGQPVYISAAGDPPTVSLTDGTDTTKSFCVGVVVSGGDTAGDVAAGDIIDVRGYGRVTGYSTNMAANIYLFVDDDAGIISTAVGTKDNIIGIGFSTTTMMVCPQPIDLS